MLMNFFHKHCGRDESFPKKELSSSEMALSLNPQSFAKSHIGERRLPLMPYPLMPYKPLA